MMHSLVCPFTFAVHLKRKLTTRATHCTLVKSHLQVIICCAMVASIPRLKLVQIVMNTTSCSKSNSFELWYCLRSLKSHGSVGSLKSRTFETREDPGLLRLPSYKCWSHAQGRWVLGTCLNIVEIFRYIYKAWQDTPNNRLKMERDGVEVTLKLHKEVSIDVLQCFP